MYLVILLKSNEFHRLIILFLKKFFPLMCLENFFFHFLYSMSSFSMRKIHSKTWFCFLSQISSHEIVQNVQNQHVINFTSSGIKVEENRVKKAKGLCMEYPGNSLC